jgi:DNA polymerase III delta subunit
VSKGPVAPPALAGHLTRNGVPPVVTAVGPETLLRDAVARTVAEQVLGDPESPQVISVQAAAGSVEFEREAVGRFFDEVRTLSLFGERKVVVLRNAESVLGKYQKLFAAWLDNPSSSVTAVVLAHELPKKLDKPFASAGLVVACGGRGRQRGEPPARFATRRAGERGKRFGAHEAGYLVELLGADLQGIEHAVEMLCLLVGEESQIQRAHVESLFTSGREGSIWEFGDLLVQGDVAGALRESACCFAEGIPEKFASRKVTRNHTTITLRLLSAFTRSVQRLVLVRRQVDAGIPREALSWGPGRPPFPSAQNKLIALSRRRPLGALESLLLFAEETDRALKSGGPPGEIAIARLATAVGMVR